MANRDPMTDDEKFALFGTATGAGAGGIRGSLVVIDIAGRSVPVGLSPISIVISAEGSSVLARVGPVGKADNLLDNLDKNRFAT